MATEVVDAELARLLTRLPDLDEATRTEVLHSLRRVADKLLHEPTVRVKELADETGAVSYAAALAELFALDPDAVDAVTRPEGLTGALTDARPPGRHPRLVAGHHPGPPGRRPRRGRLGRPVELVEVSTEGDRSDAPLAPLGGTGVFVTALREALLDGRVDVAVHSLKDLPTAPAPGIALAAVPLREDPRDVVVARDGLTLGELPVGSRVGTGSPRRAAQLHALGLGLDFVDIRGNVDTPDRQGRGGGVRRRRARPRRTGPASAVSTRSPRCSTRSRCCPPPGRARWRVECRADDPAVRSSPPSITRPPARPWSAERAVLATLEGGCSAPIGALAEVVEGDDGDELWVRAVALSLDGPLAVRMSATGTPRRPPIWAHGSHGHARRGSRRTHRRTRSRNQ